MADIFVSYKKEDRALAEQIVSALRDASYSVWWDEDLTPRTNWDAEIEREIHAAKAVVVLWTPRAVAENSFVRAEAHYAKEHRKLVPVRLESCELPLAFRQIQTMDLSSWDRRSLSDRRWIRTLSWIAQCISGEATSAPEIARSSTTPGNRKLWWPAGAISAVLIVVLVSFAVFRPFAAPRQTENGASPLESTQIDTADADAEAWNTLLTSYPLDYNQQDNSRLNRVGRRLAEASGVELNWEFAIAQADFFDVRSSPGGKIWLTSRVMRHVNNPNATDPNARATTADERLAGIIALTLAHTLAGHDRLPDGDGDSAARRSEDRRIALQLLERGGYDTNLMFALVESAGQ